MDYERSTSDYSLSLRPKQHTREEREQLMRYEVHRLDTFSNAWQISYHQLPGEQMAEAGFYYDGEHDKVTCAFCRGWLDNWQPNDSPLKEHKEKYPHCPFIKGQSENVAANTQNFPSDKRHTSSILDATPNNLPLQGEGPSFPDLADKTRRRNTFHRWPKPEKSHQELASAGFYYTSVEDKVRCFYCAIELDNWNAQDCPWQEHAKWSGECAYLISKKGRFWVQQVRNQVQDFKDELRREALAKGHRSHDMETVLENNGQPFDSEEAMRAAVTALDDPIQLPVSVQPADLPDDIAMQEGMYNAKNETIMKIGCLY